MAQQPQPEGPTWSNKNWDVLDELEEEAQDATLASVEAALLAVGNVLEANEIVFGVRGGLNLYTRGSPRATTDVDMAIDVDAHGLTALLQLFRHNTRVTRPLEPTNWAAGTARIFYRVSPEQVVQLDLMRNLGGDALSTVPNLADSIETLHLRAHEAHHSSFLNIAAECRSKLRAHADRGDGGDSKDYNDVWYILSQAANAATIRGASPNWSMQHRSAYLESALGDPNHHAREATIRDLLNLPALPHASGNTHGGNGGGGRGGGNAHGSRGSNSSPGGGKNTPPSSTGASHGSKGTTTGGHTGGVPVKTASKKMRTSRYILNGAFRRVQPNQRTNGIGAHVTNGNGVTGAHKTGATTPSAQKPAMTGVRSAKVLPAASTTQTRTATATHATGRTNTTTPQRR